jgi:hypothetical protein
MDSCLRNQAGKFPAKAASTEERSYWDSKSIGDLIQGAQSQILLAALNCAGERSG